MVAQYIGSPPPSVIIGSMAQKTAKLVRDYSQSQAETWRMVPWLALQAEGRVSRHYTDSWLASAYKYGMWVLPVSQSLKMLAFVDCETGKLVDHELKPLGDLQVLAISAQVADLDASRICTDLSERARHVFGDARDAYWNDWRSSMAIAAAIERVYTRSMPLNWDNWID